MGRNQVELEITAISVVARDSRFVDAIELESRCAIVGQVRSYEIIARVRTKASERVGSIA